MKKSVKTAAKVIFAAVCLVVLAALILQVQTVTLENGVKKLLYTPLFESLGGGSVNADLLLELSGIYGGENVKTEKYSGQAGGENYTVYDISSYTFEPLGKGPDGEIYVLCTVPTLRRVEYEGSESAAEETERICEYIGFNDNDIASTARAEILWGTLKEEYPDGEDYFNGLIEDDK